MIFLCKENFNMRLFYYLSTCQTCKHIIKDLDLDDSIQKIDIKKNAERTKIIIGVKVTITPLLIGVDN